MIDILRSTGHAFELVASDVASVSIPLLLLGVLLQVISQMVRTRGWHTIIRASYPSAIDYRPMYTMRAYMAGSGVNAVIPARGGDVVKLWLVRRRIPESRYTTLAATFVPDGISESVIGVALIGWALSKGFLPVPLASGELPQFDLTFVLHHPIWSTMILVVLAALLVVIWRWLRRHITDFAARLRQGVAILGSPGLFIKGVVSWQLLSRLIRLGSLAALMGAFALPVSVSTTVLVMAAQGGGRIIPLAPAAAGLRLAMLSYGFVEVTGEAVDIAQITAFTVGVGAALLIAGLTVGLIALLFELETRSPRAAIAEAQRAIALRKRRAST